MANKRMARFWTEDRISRLKQLYPDTTNLKLAEIFDVSVNAIEHMATKYSLRKRIIDGRGKQWTGERIQRLRELYSTNKNADLAVFLDTSVSAIQSAARRFGLKKDKNWRTQELRSWAASSGRLYGKAAGQNRRKTFFNETYFSYPLSPESAYWLGFIQADGCITEELKYPRLTIKLALRDADHLDRFLLDIECNRLSNRGDKSAECRLSSVRMVKDLLDLGVQPRKSKNGTFPMVSGVLFQHYLRGVFDGDGWISSASRTQPAIVITGSEDFGEWALDQIRNNTGITGGSVLKDTKAACWNLSITGKNQVRLFYDWLYEGATRWLPRKRKRFENIFEVRRKILCG